MPFDGRPCLARPRRPVRRLGLEGPFADQRLEPLQRLLCGWLVHCLAPSSGWRLWTLATRYEVVKCLPPKEMPPPRLYSPGCRQGSFSETQSPSCLVVCCSCLPCSLVGEEGNSERSITET